MIVNNMYNLCPKIINSVIVVGLYYGFMTALSIKPSHIFLIRALLLEKETNKNKGVAEETKKKVAATTGFIMGQFIRLISIYYGPLYVALGRPHTITILALPYLLIHLFWNTDKSFFAYDSNKLNSIRNLEIYCVFLNHFALQLLNSCILPNSTLARLVSIYMFRCNNKILFLTSSFFAWFIGQLFILNCFELVLVWIRKKNSIRSTFRNYLLRNSIFVIFLNCIFGSLLFLLSIQCLGRIPSPIPTQKLSEVSKIEQRERERLQKEEERGVEKKEQSTEEDPSLFLEEKAGWDKEKEPDYKFPDSELEILQKKKIKNQEFEKHLAALLFDYKRWTRPFRYIKNNHLEQALRNEMSQYFFDTYQSDGKNRLSFTHPISLSAFLKMIKPKIPLLLVEKNTFNSNSLDNGWVYRNKKQMNYLRIDFLNRVKNLDKAKAVALPRIEFETTRTQLCIHNDENKQEYLPENFDPLLNGPYRGRIKKGLLPINDTLSEHLRETVMLNRLHALVLLNTNSKNSNQKMSTFGKKPLEICGFSTFNLNLMDSELKTEVLVNPIETHDLNFLKKYSTIEEISKKVPRWSYKLITELEQISYYKNPPDDHDIRSRKGISVVIFDPNKEATTTNSKTNTTKDTNLETKKESESDEDKLVVIRYPQQSDFRQGLIKDSMRNQRRKIIIWELFNANVHSPLFFDRLTIVFSFPRLKQLFINLSARHVFGISKSTDKKRGKTKKEEKRENKQREQKERLEIGEAWDVFPVAQIIRGFLLLNQTFIRKKIILPSLIIGKNIGRILLFQIPEWSEDLRELNRETHIKCTYNGIPLSEKEFPENWLTEGIQIKILFPFCLKPWHPYKPQTSHYDFCFLTVWGRETEQPFGHPRKTPSFFEPVLQELDKKIVNINIKARIFSKVKINLFKRFSKEKDFQISNQIINESFQQIEEIPGCTNSSLIEKMQNMAHRTSTIKKEIERVTEEKKRVTLERYICFYKRSYRLALAKNIFKKVKVKVTKNRLICKFFFFKKLFNQRIYNNIFLETIYICRITTQLFLESTKKLIYKYIFNYERNKKRIDINKETKNKFNLISKLKTYNHCKKNSYLSCDLSNLSQAYVFYKIPQTGVLNVCKLISALQQNGIPSFIKTQIKDSFHTQGICKYELIQKKLQWPKTNQWKNWLRVNSEYDLSHILWFSLISQKQKWRNRVEQYHRSKEKYLNKRNSRGNYRLSDSKKQNVPKPVSDNYKKCYQYDLLSYKSINYAKKSASVISRSTPKGQAISYNDNMLQNIPGKIKRLYITYIPYIGKTLDRKYLIWKNIHFYLRKKVDIESWVAVNTSSDKDSTIGTYNYQLIDQIDKKEKELFSIPIRQNTEINRPNSTNSLVDWMGMNEQILNRPITNLELWFFPEFVWFFNVYKTKPWIIPSKILILNSNLSETDSKQKSETDSKQKSETDSKQKSETDSKQKSETDSKQKSETDSKQKSETDSKQKSETDSKQKSETDSKQKNNAEIQKDLDEDSTKSDKKNKKEKETELELFAKKYFLFQLRGDPTFKKSFFKNIQIYCLLLRLTNRKKMTLSCIQRRKFNLRIMPTMTNLFNVPEFLKMTGLVMDPLPLLIKTNGKFLLYQIVGISLVHKSKHQTNQTYRKRIIIRAGMTNLENNHLDVLVLENILSSRCRREFRTLICLNYKNWNGVNTNSIFCSKNCNQFWEERKPQYNEKRELIQKFLWPNYRLEDLACVNRYSFDITNGSRFSLLRFHMYLPWKIHG
uniref:Protein TIC 214 n=1 Tax=Cuscuta reflexa TaxID=4129 RepID=TI214_CUSRE|nr:ycf1 protein [Cuscuta reflexa]A7M9B2.1 RecName: Full=Protein TIC 214; AltName: Full=Translocon at the inner envelope membrane of chloroplasts 214; Short=AtTIC214 [Cuscuta reflexa]CAM98440.1 ycf1 protein [Cuscuta reflexa]